MSWLIAIDKLLALTSVRWGLLVALAIGTIYLVVLQGRFTVTKLQLEAEKGRNTTLSAAMGLQSEAIRQAGRDMESAKKRAQEANQKAAELREALKKRKTEIVEVVLQGDCPDMVQQVLDEVRK